MKNDEKIDEGTAQREIIVSHEQIKKMREIIKEDAAQRQSGVRDSSTSVIKERK